MKFISSRNVMTSWTGMCIRRSREGVCKNNAMQFLFSYGSSYCTAPGEMAVLSSANSEILVWSDDGAGNSLKADSMCTTQIVVTEHSRWCQNWWEVCGKQFCRTGASQFRNFLVNWQMSRLLLHEIVFSVTGKRSHNNGEVQTELFHGSRRWP